eukprot:TRINITY_DN8447_c0_g1_i1.p1 TRINITY_DN8447_c0_g1~~TRINITY_DN8447_c0_g1_i1.p1  ORF type:complete len:447 (+),score=101.17 TRINITY_DN8447_c0_g1_i1:49-1341(+)
MAVKKKVQTKKVVDVEAPPVVNGDGPKTKKKKVGKADTDGEERANSVAKVAAAVSSALHFGPHTKSGKLAPSFSQMAAAEAPELVTTLRQLRRRLEDLREAADRATERFAKPAGKDEGTDNNSAYVEMKVQLMLSHLISLLYYLMLKVQGTPVKDHPVMMRLIWVRTLLEKLRPVDQRLQYSMTRALRWAAAVANPESDVGDPRALRPGELATTVEDVSEDDDAAGTAKDADGDGIYKPPRIAQVDYTGDHVSALERAEKDLERKRDRLQRSEFVRTLREEFTDAPAEFHGRIRTTVAEKAQRKLAEQQEYEEENMTRLRTSKRDKRAQRRLLRDTNVTSGAVSLNELSDFKDLANSLEPNAGGDGRRGKRERRGSALSEYQDASQRTRHARGVVESTLDGLSPSMAGGKRKGGGGRGGGDKGGGKRRRK